MRMVVSWNKHNEIIVQCGQRVHSRFLIESRIKTANILCLFMFVHMLTLELIMLVCHILQSGVVQKNKLSYQSVISDISD